MTFAQLPAGTIINIPFQISTVKYGLLASAINLTPAEAAAFTAADFVAKRQELRDAWVAARDSQPPPHDPTDEEANEEVQQMGDRLERFFLSLTPAQRSVLKAALRERFT